jgi:hypothetical protein
LRLLSKGRHQFSRAEVADGPLMTDALDGVGQPAVGRNQPVEIVFADFQQIGVLEGANRGSARTSAEQGHFTKSVPLAKLGNGAAGFRPIETASQDFHLSTRDDVEGITGVSGLEQNFGLIQMAGVDARQDLLDLFRWQMPHQVTGRQQLDSLVGVRLFARKRIFAELGDVAHRRSLLLQKERCRIINDSPGSKSGADKSPCRVGIEALMMK